MFSENIQPSIIQTSSNYLLRQLKKFVKFIGFNKHGEEYQQAIFRLVIITGFMVSLFVSNLEIKTTIPLVWGNYVLFSIAVLYHTRVSPNPNRNRQLITMLMDVLLTSVALYLTSDFGAVLIGVYLWLVIGYGFRYGRKMLIATYLASLIGFISASLLSHHWQSNTTGFYGLLFTLISIPMYALSLLTKLKEATHKAEAASRAKSEFLSHISHEIRTPLNGIVGASSLIDASSLDKNNAALFNVMRASSTVLLDLVNNVLDLSKIESGKTLARTEDFYLHNLVLTTVHLFESQVAQKNVTIEYDISKDSPEALHGDLQHTKQVLINLVGNAVKFTEFGTVKIYVSTLDQDTENARMRFEVIDSGIGIAQDSLGKIFESFTQAEESIRYKFGGTGLGTTISKNLVELMGGKIGAESQLGVGSTFWFELPLKKINSESPFANTVSSEVIPFKKFDIVPKKNAYRILVAEDNDTNILILSQMLQLSNHQFDVVKNGELALDKLQDNEYDLMILDYNMPVMGGLEALKIYQALNAGLPQIPAIILSADATEQTVAEFEEVGIAAYLSKPIMIDLLNSTIEEVASKSNKKPLVQAATVVQFDASKRAAENDVATQTAQLKNALVDIDRLHELSAISANANFVKELIEGFVVDTDLNFSLLKQHVKNRAFIQINNTGHAIAGSATNMGANKLSKICVKLNDITPDEHAMVDKLFTEAEATYASTKEALAMYLTQVQAMQNSAQMV